jgi:hypothetical protein
VQRRAVWQWFRRFRHLAAHVAAILLENAVIVASRFAVYDKARPPISMPYRDIAGAVVTLLARLPRFGNIASRFGESVAARRYRHRR